MSKYKKTGVNLPPEAITFTAVVKDGRCIGYEFNPGFVALPPLGVKVMWNGNHYFLRQSIFVDGDGWNLAFVGREGFRLRESFYLKLTYDILVSSEQHGDTLVILAGNLIEIEGPVRIKIHKSVKVPDLVGNFSLSVPVYSASELEGCQGIFGE